MNEEQLNTLLLELVALPEETEWVEFKLNKGSISNQQIGEYISAMSNGATITSQPFGYLVWGVQDATHVVLGTNFSFRKAKHGNQDLELWLRNLLYPKINIEIFEFRYNDRRIALIRIPAAKGEPTHFQKKAYIRIGSNKTDLGNFPEYIRTIYNSQEDWSAGIIERATIDDLDTEALDLARVKYKERNTRASFYDQIDSWDTATFLDKAKVTIKGKITNAAIILLGKEESSHFLLPATTEITWKLETEEKAYEHFGPPLLFKYYPDFTTN